MRINPKLYEVANDATPVEVQEFDGRKIEIFFMDDYPAVKEEFINQGKFAIWASVDGKNYRVFIETGYYEELKELYTQPVNKIWVDFWDICENISKKTTRTAIIPVTISAVALVFLFYFVLPKNVQFYVMLAVVVVAFGLMMFFNRLTKKKIYEANQNSVEEIKKAVGGSNNFDRLLDRQKSYMDEYYDALYEDEEAAETAETETPVEETQTAEVLEAPIIEAEIEEVKEEKVDQNE